MTKKQANAVRDIRTLRLEIYAVLCWVENDLDDHPGIYGYPRRLEELSKDFSELDGARGMIEKLAKLEAVAGRHDPLSDA